MEMPKAIKIAVPVNPDGHIDGRTLRIMRNKAWKIVTALDYEDDKCDA
jgi:hypothetical protein